jgi:TonB family protein
MVSRSNRLPAQRLDVPRHGFGLLVELEPGLRSFLDNLADVFRRPAPPIRLATPPGDYWSDALVHRPVAWKSMVQSYLGHVLAVAAIYAGSLWWLNQPHVIVEEPLQTSTILSYQVSEYLPEVKPQAEQQEPPVRKEARTADPEYSPQKIVSLNVDHRSTRQNIVQPDPNLLRQDVAIPNIIAWTPVPIAPPETVHQRLLDLPSGAPVVVPPAQQTVEHGAARLVFPPAAQPQVVEPSGPVTANRATPMMVMDSPVVIPPSQDVAARDPSRLQLQVQAPQVAAAPTDIATRSALSTQALPMAQPDVVAPAQETGQRSLAAMALPESGPNVAPPSPPVASAMGQQRSRDAGQLLALNASPLPPDSPVKIPSGNRQGEFAAGPEGHRGTSATPEATAGNPSSANHAGAGGSGSVYVEAPPVKTAGGQVATGPRLAPPLAAKAPPAAAVTDVPSSDSIDNRVFGGRKRYSMHLNMPNLNSSMGSWTVRFAELNLDPADRSDLTAPEAIRKVDPAYPANLMQERVEGVVVLHAVIRSDGSVSEVRVLEGFYDELDENARSALEQWRFRPGTKNGVPVDVEAVIRVPFRVPRNTF